MGAMHAHDSWEELLQSSLFSLRMEGGSSMSCSHCMRKNCGKGVDYFDLSHVYMHPLTTYMAGYLHDGVVKSMGTLSWHKIFHVKHHVVTTWMG